MTTTTRPDAVLAPADNDVLSPAQMTPERAAEKTLEKTPDKKRHRVVPLVVGAVAVAVAFGAGLATGSNLTWRFSIWWKPS